MNLVRVIHHAPRARRGMPQKWKQSSASGGVVACRVSRPCPQRSGGLARLGALPARIACWRAGQRRVAERRAAVAGRCAGPRGGVRVTGVGAPAGAGSAREKRAADRVAACDGTAGAKACCGCCSRLGWLGWLGWLQLRWMAGKKRPLEALWKAALYKEARGRWGKPPCGETGEHAPRMHPRC